MARDNLTHRLPQVRVSQDLYERVQRVAHAQEMNMAEVQRAALEYYCIAGEQPEGKTVKIPIVGIIANGTVIPYRKAA